MVKKKACKHSKLLINDIKECPADDTLANSWQGRINVLDPEKSEIAKKVGHDKAGEYAIKVR